MTAALLAVRSFALLSPLPSALSLLSPLSLHSPLTALLAVLIAPAWMKDSLRDGRLAGGSFLPLFSLLFLLSVSLLCRPTYASLKRALS